MRNYFGRKNGNGSKSKVTNVDYQLAEETVTETPEGEEVAEETEASNKVKDTNFGEVRSGTFSIKVTKQEKATEGENKGKMVEKVLYENKKEPFQYDFCSSLSNCLVHAGAKLTDDAVAFIGTALKNEQDAEADKAIGLAVAKLVKTYNTKLKADAKSSAYQALVNKHKPLEGEDREVAIAKTIRGFVKLSGISVETAIEVLKSKKAVPEDYTVEDYNTTPLRKTKGSEDEEE